MAVIFVKCKKSYWLVIAPFMLHYCSKFAESFLLCCSSCNKFSTVQKNSVLPRWSIVPSELRWLKELCNHGSVPTVPLPYPTMHRDKLTMARMLQS